MIPDWKLEKYLTGDLPANEMRELQELEMSDEIFAGRVRMYREDSKAILKKLPFESLSQKMEMRRCIAEGMSQSRGMHVYRSGNNAKILKFAVAAALALAFVSVALFGQKELTPAEMEQGAGADVAMVDIAHSETGDGFGAGSDTRIKGMDVRMEVWKKSAAGIVQLENMSDASEGDEIQLRYSVPQKCFGMLFSMDGNGVMTLHMGEGNEAVALEPGKMVSLPYAYKLDDAPKFEKFFFVTSQKHFAVVNNDVDATLKQEGVHVESLTLRKVEGGK